MGTGHPCQASRRVPCLHEQCVCHVSPPFRMGSPAFACSSAQKREKSLWSSCWWLVYPIQMPPFLAEERNDCSLVYFRISSLSKCIDFALSVTKAPIPC